MSNLTTSTTTASGSAAGTGMARKAEISMGDIQREAYSIYQQREAEGEPGDSLSDWLQAEASLGVTTD